MSTKVKIFENILFGGSLTIVGLEWVKMISDFSVILNPILVSISAIIAIVIGLMKIFKKR